MRDRNKIDSSKHTRKKNLLPALDKALDYLDATTNWIAKNPKEVDYDCCGSCIFGSSQFNDETKPRVTYNIQDRDDYRQAYKENRVPERWDFGYGYEVHRGEYLYLQHYAPTHKDYLKLIEVLNEHGIYADWNWSSESKILVVLDRFKDSAPIGEE
tara:strand:- start:107 stop:574 length:468 start_codon:yes stop_codon:yes gene_type:complete